jgi:HSP20 family molecular chaperone IbpA
MSAQEVEKRSERSPQETVQDYVLIPAVDVSETENEYILTASMPGVGKDDVDVSVEDHVLTVEGRAREEEPADCRNVAREFEVGHYRRSFELSEDVDAGAIKANVKNGLLKITLPKREEVKPKKIQVNVG